MFTSIVLRISDPKSQTAFSMLSDRIAQAPNFFRHAPVVLDLQDLADAPPFNIAELGRRLRQHSLVPIGVQNATEEQTLAAVNAGFSIVAGSGKPTALPDSRSEQTHSSAETGETDSHPQSSAKVVTRPVRSGQQAYAASGDLIVLSLTSSGAELLADGHIHVYGALRGRALAGVCGDTGARIFCRSLEADLVSIAGYWQVRDDIPDALIGKPAQISLQEEKLIIEPLP
jgi:septum site-determining protein MinC